MVNERILPILLQMKGKIVTVIGGGQMALRNIKRYLQAGAMVEVYTEEYEQEIEDLFEQGLIRLYVTTLKGDETFTTDILCLATDNKDIHELIIKANQHVLLINDAANRLNSSFQVMSYMREPHLLMAWSTQGASPIFAKRLKKDLKEKLPLKQYDEQLAFLAKARELIKQIDVDSRQKQQLLVKITDESFLDKEDREKRLLDYVLSLTRRSVK